MNTDERTPPKCIEIVSEREFPVSRERLYEAFANPNILARWWGPAGFTNTFHEFDLRTGGSWRFDMHGPDGKDYPNGKRFVEVLPGERVVFDHAQPMHLFRMTIDFLATDSGSKMHWRMVFAPGHGDQATQTFIEKANEENLDRLEAVLAEPA